MHIDNKSALLFTLDSISRVQEIVKPLAEYLGINFFGYMKLYNNCSFSVLINGYSDFLNNYFNLIKEQDTYFKNEFRSTIDNGPNTFLWPTEYKEIPAVASLHNEHDIWHGYSINYRHSEYIEHYAFAFNKNASNKTDFFIKNSHVLEKFCHYFKSKASDIIKKQEQGPKSSYPKRFDISCIEEQSRNRQKFFDEINKNKKSLIANKDGSLIKLTKRESECISILMKNKTVKEIGSTLNLSPRTVEHYIDNVKQKLGIRYKSELLDILLT